MSRVIIAPAGNVGGFIPAQVLGALGQTVTVTSQEVANEILSRGYTEYVTPISPPVTAPITSHTMPAMTRQQAISKGVTRALSLYGYAAKCTRLGGCPLSESRFTYITSRGVTYANQYLAQTVTVTRTASISPAPSSPYGITVLNDSGSVSTRLSGVGRELYGLGQDSIFAPIGAQPPTYPVQAPGTEQPGMTTWDWVSVISRATQGVASTLEAYANARAQRERAGQTAQLTADQVKMIVNEAILQNPTLNKAQLTAAAAGAGGREEPKGLPSWVIPAGIGAVVVAFMSSRRGRMF